MKKTFYELRTVSAEIRCGVPDICPGCVFDFLRQQVGADCSSELIERFDDEQTALAALAECKTIIRTYGCRHFRIEEAFVEENVYEIDEDGGEEWIDGGVISGYSAMPDELVHDAMTYRFNARLGRYEEADAND